jgi:hypothetical protein
MALIYLTLAPFARQKEEDQKKQGKGGKKEIVIAYFPLILFFGLFFKYLGRFSKKEKKIPTVVLLLI